RRRRFGRSRDDRHRRAAHGKDGDQARQTVDAAAPRREGAIRTRGGILMSARVRGFTLLEVMVAVAILGLSLTAILSAQAGSFAASAHARNISVATGLARCKMSEIEEHLLRDGYPELDEADNGVCCEGDETPNMRCAWKVEKP